MGEKTIIVIVMIIRKESKASSQSMRFPLGSVSVFLSVRIMKDLHSGISQKPQPLLVTVENSNGPSNRFPFQMNNTKGAKDGNRKSLLPEHDYCEIDCVSSIIIIAHE